MSSPRAKVVALPNPSVTSSPLISPEDLKTWPVSQVVDSLYSHRSRVEAFKPIVAAEKALELELVRRCEDQPADAIVPLGGRIAFANLGPKPNKRVVTSPAKLFRLMKKYSEDAFQSLCSFALADVDRFIPESEHKQFLTEKRSGKRSVEVYAHPAVEIAVESSSLPKAA